MSSSDQPAYNNTNNSNPLFAIPHLLSPARPRYYQPAMGPSSPSAQPPKPPPHALRRGHFLAVAHQRSWLTAARARTVAARAARALQVGKLAVPEPLPTVDGSAAASANRTSRERDDDRGTGIGGVDAPAYTVSRVRDNRALVEIESTNELIHTIERALNIDDDDNDDGNNDNDSDSLENRASVMNFMDVVVNDDDDGDNGSVEGGGDKDKHTMTIEILDDDADGQVNSNINTHTTTSNGGRKTQQTTELLGNGDGTQIGTDADSEANYSNDKNGDVDDNNNDYDYDEDDEDVIYVYSSDDEPNAQSDTSSHPSSNCTGFADITDDETPPRPRVHAQDRARATSGSSHARRRRMSSPTYNDTGSSESENGIDKEGSEDADDENENNSDSDIERPNSNDKRKSLSTKKRSKNNTSGFVHEVIGTDKDNINDNVANVVEALPAPGTETGAAHNIQGKSVNHKQQRHKETACGDRDGQASSIIKSSDHSSEAKSDKDNVRPLSATVDKTKKTLRSSGGSNMLSSQSLASTGDQQRSHPGSQLSSASASASAFASSTDIYARDVEMTTRKLQGLLSSDSTTTAEPAVSASASPLPTKTSPSSPKHRKSISQHADTSVVNGKVNSQGSSASDIRAVTNKTNPLGRISTLSINKRVSTSAKGTAGTSTTAPDSAAPTLRKATDNASRRRASPVEKTPTLSKQLPPAGHPLSSSSAVSVKADTPQKHTDVGQLPLGDPFKTPPARGRGRGRKLRTVPNSVVDKFNSDDDGIRQQVDSSSSCDSSDSDSDSDDASPSRVRVRRTPRVRTPRTTARVARVPGCGELQGTSTWLSVDVLRGRTSFSQARDDIANALYKYFNEEVLDGVLDGVVNVSWNVRLCKTAGVTYLKLRQPQMERIAKIELSTKVLDCVPRLYNTLAHELCHAAAWVVGNVTKPPHGKEFREWAHRFHEWDHNLVITTCHEYDIRFRFNYTCTNNACGVVYGRHSRSIDVEKKVCGRCKSKLKLNVDRNIGKVDLVF